MFWMYSLFSVSMTHICKHSTPNLALNHFDKSANKLVDIFMKWELLYAMDSRSLSNGVPW